MCLRAHTLRLQRRLAFGHVARIATIASAFELHGNPPDVINEAITHPIARSLTRFTLIREAYRVIATRYLVL